MTPLGMTMREPLAAIRDWAETHIHEIITARHDHGARYDQDGGKR